MNGKKKKFTKLTFTELVITLVYEKYKVCISAQSIRKFHLKISLTSKGALKFL